MPVQPFDIEKVYKEDPNLKKEDIKILQEWAEKQPHFPPINERQLIFFLHSCYYRVEPAKVTIDNFFTTRTLCPEMYGFHPIEQIRQCLQVGFYTVVPEKTPEGYIVLLCKLIDYNPDVYTFYGQLNLMDIILSLYFYQHGPCNGLIVVLDGKGLTFQHVAKFSLVGLKTHMFYVQEAAPVRIKAIHHINVNPWVEKLVALTKPFLKKELLEMLHFHSTMEAFYKYVPKRMLSEDYGGDAPSVATVKPQNEKMIFDNIDYLMSTDSQKVNESKRPGKPKTADDMFGVDGTFKKLELD